MFEKRLLAVAIVAGLGFGLSACGSDGNSGVQEEIGGGVDTPAPVEPETSPGAGDQDPSTPEPGGTETTGPESGSGAEGSTPTEPDPEPGPEPEPEPEPEPGPEPEPQPEPEPGNGSPTDPGPSSGSGSAAADCLIGQNLQPGARWHMEYRVTSAGNTGTQTHDATATRRTSFNGHSAVEIEETSIVNLSGVPRTEIQSTTWQDLVTGNVLELYGHRTVTEVMGAPVTTVSTYEPVWRDMKYTLGVGETAPYSYTMKTVTTMSVMGHETEHESTFTATGSWTYRGMESVSVPAGTFNTCKFTQVEEGTTSDEWMLPGSGLVVKSFSRDADPAGAVVTIELTAGSFNGAPLRQ